MADAPVFLYIAGYDGEAAAREDHDAALEAAGAAD